MICMDLYFVPCMTFQHNMFQFVSMVKKWIPQRQIGQLLLTWEFWILSRTLRILMSVSLNKLWTYSTESKHNLWPYDKYIDILILQKFTWMIAECDQLENNCKKTFFVIWLNFLLKSGTFSFLLMSQMKSTFATHS